MIVKDVSKIYSLFYNTISPCKVSLDEKLMHEIIIIIIIIIIILPQPNQGVCNLEIGVDSR